MTPPNPPTQNPLHTTVLLTTTSFFFHLHNTTHLPTSRHPTAGNRAQQIHKLATLARYVFFNSKR